MYISRLAEDKAESKESKASLEKKQITNQTDGRFGFK